VNKVPGPLHVGPLVIDLPVALAPLAGYTDAAYRLVCRECGAGFTATGVLLDRSVLHESKARREMLAHDPADHPVAAQVMGSEPGTMAEAAALLAGSGFDVIDLNFACPVRKVLARRRGGWLMRDPARALEMIRAVRSAVPGTPLTVKLRKSFSDDGRDERAFWSIAEGAFELGAAALTVHARSVEQGYRRQADYAFLARVKAAFREGTVIGSGDLLTPPDIFRMFRETGVDGVSVARGAIGNPWFFRHVRDLAAGREPKPPGLAEQRSLIERHYGLSVRFFGEVRGFRKMRNFGIMYARLHPAAREVKMAFVAVKSPEEWRRVLERYYA